MFNFYLSVDENTGVRQKHFIAELWLNFFFLFKNVLHHDAPWCFIFCSSAYDPVRHLCTLPSPLLRHFMGSDTAEMSHLSGDWIQTSGMMGGNRCKLCSIKFFQTSVIFTFGRTDHSTHIRNDLDSITETRIQAKCKPPWLFMKLHTRDMTHIAFRCLKYTMSRRLCPDGWSFLLSNKYACDF